MRERLPIPYPLRELAPCPKRAETQPFSIDFSSLPSRSSAFSLNAALDVGDIAYSTEFDSSEQNEVVVEKGSKIIQHHTMYQNQWVP